MPSDAGWFASIEFIANRYQTLAAGGAALLGAWLTVKWMRRQIEVDQLRDAEENARLLHASRAMLPVAITEVSTYAQNCVQLSLGMLTEFTHREDGRKQIRVRKIPELPYKSFDLIEKAIRHSERRIQDGLADLVNVLQIHHARLASLNERAAADCDEHIILKFDFYAAIAAALEVEGLAADFYVYARGGEYEPSERERASLMAYSFPDVRNNLRRYGFKDAEYPDLIEWLDSQPLLCKRLDSLYKQRTRKQVARAALSPTPE